VQQLQDLGRAGEVAGQDVRHPRAMMMSPITAGTAYAKLTSERRAPAEPGCSSSANVEKERCVAPTRLWMGNVRSARDGRRAPYRPASLEWAAFSTNLSPSFCAPDAARPSRRGMRCGRGCGGFVQVGRRCLQSPDLGKRKGHDRTQRHDLADRRFLRVSEPLPARTASRVISTARRSFANEPPVRTLSPLGPHRRRSAVRRSGNSLPRGALS